MQRGRSSVSPDRGGSTARVRQSIRGIESDKARAVVGNRLGNGVASPSQTATQFVRIRKTLISARSCTAGSCGAAGLENAVASLWPEVPTQRCNVHKHRNLLAHEMSSAILLALSPDAQPGRVRLAGSAGPRRICARKCRNPPFNPAHRASERFSPVVLRVSPGGARWGRMRSATPLRYPAPGEFAVICWAFSFRCPMGRIECRIRAFQHKFSEPASGASERTTRKRRNRGAMRDRP